jgi:hypothetical protein
MRVSECERERVGGQLLLESVGEHKWLATQG